MSLMTSEPTLVQDFSLHSAFTGFVSLEPPVPGVRLVELVSGQLFSLSTSEEENGPPRTGV